MKIADAAAALKTIASTITGIEQVAWLNQQRDYVDPGTRAIVLLSFGPIVGIGRDEQRETFDETADGEEFTTTTNGLRKVSWSLRVDSYEQTDDENAWVFLENARLRLAWPSVAAALSAAGIGLVSVGDTRDLQVPEDERVISRATLEVALHVMLHDDDPETSTYIASFSGTSTLGGNVREYEVT